MHLKIALHLYARPAMVPPTLLGLMAVSAGLLLTPTPGLAQSAAANTLVKPEKTSTAAAVTASLSSSDWASLTPRQHDALKPLATHWVNLSDPQKRKWITLSANYPHMSVADQAKLHQHMVQWASLTPRQREQARLNFAETKQITPQQKNEKWQAYQALSAEDKQKLAKSAQPKPPSTALAAQPVGSDKINRMPMTKSLTGGVPPASTPTLSKNTLLTKPKPPTPPTLPKIPTPAMRHDTNSQ